jgi:hypothetical protein
MHSETSPARVEQELADTAHGSPAQELVFNPCTGELSVTSVPDPDAIVATDPARDGYFR